MTFPRIAALPPVESRPLMLTPEEIRASRRRIEDQILVALGKRNLDLAIVYAAVLAAAEEEEP